MTKTHYATLGVAPTATQDQVKRAYRKLARRYHPDVSHEPAAEERFKDVAAAHETLIDPERRARYDAELAAPPERTQRASKPRPRQRHAAADSAHAADARMQQAFRDFFAHATTAGPRPLRGADQHATLLIDLGDAYRGATRTLNLQTPLLDAHGDVTFQDRTLEVRIPKGVVEGQQLRLQGQGASGKGGAPAGNLYLELVFLPHPKFRLDAHDVYLDLPVTPWEAALGATVTAPTPTGSVLLTIPPGSAAQRRLRLKGLGLPGSPPGDLYAVLGITLPPGDSAPAQQAYRALASAFPDYQPRP